MSEGGGGGFLGKARSCRGFLGFYQMCGFLSLVDRVWEDVGHVDVAFWIFLVCIGWGMG